MVAKFGMDFSKVLGQLDQVQRKPSYENNDAEFWKPSPDKAGNATALIRFLPNKDANEFPFVRIWKHSFKDPSTGQWYIENSLTTIGQQDYIAETNTELWNTGTKENRAIVSNFRKRKLSYISNILVINDKANPDNNGKVFKFRYGQKIFDKIAAAMKPEEGMGIDPINPFDPMEGANFTLIQKKVADFPNFDESRFTAVTPIAGGKEKEVAAILEMCFDLGVEVAPDKFKTYEELKERFLKVTTGKGGTKPTRTQQQEFDSGDDELDKLAMMAKTQSKPKAKAPPVMEESIVDDEDADFFKSLVDD